MEKNEGRKWRKCTDGKNLGRKINKGCSRGRELGEAITGQAEPLTKGENGMGPQNIRSHKTPLVRNRIRNA